MDDESPIRWEAFHVGGVPAGVLARRLHPAGLDTLTCFQVPDGPLVHLEHTLAFTGDPLAWTRFRHRRVHEGAEVERTDDQVAPGVLPSYGEFLMLDRLGTGAEASYRSLAEQEPDAAPAEVVLRAVGSEVITTPGGAAIDCTRVEVTHAGTRTNTHWLDSSGLRASDWNGATSWRVAGRAELPRVAGVPEVVDAWLESLAGRDDHGVGTAPKSENPM